MVESSLEMQSLVELDEARQKMIETGSMWVFPRHDLEIDREPDSREAANEYVAAARVSVA